MKILCLYNNECALPLFQYLRQEGHEILLYTEPLTKEQCREFHADLAVSYTYRYILSGEVLDALNGNAVNLHNSYLPWNRGSDPNIWSIIEKTPRGVSLHYMESGLDKGAIIVQKLVPLKPSDTLKTSYEALDKAAKELFAEAFKIYSFWPEMRKRATGTGSYHSIADGDFFRRAIRTYDIPVKDFQQIIERDRR